MAVAAPAARRAVAPARRGGRWGYRLRRRLQLALRSGVRRGFPEGSSRGRRLDDPAVLQAADAEWRRGPHQSSLEAVQQSILAGGRERRGRVRRARSPLSVRREARRCLDALDGRRAGREGRQPAAAFPDRFQHSCGLHSDRLLCRRVARRSCNPRQAERQEDHRRRHRARDSATVSAFPMAKSSRVPSSRRWPPNRSCRAGCCAGRPISA